MKRTSTSANIVNDLLISLLFSFLTLSKHKLDIFQFYALRVGTNNGALLVKELLYTVVAFWVVLLTG